MFDGFLDDLKRMNKRQVGNGKQLCYIIFTTQSSFFNIVCYIIYFKYLMILGSLSSIVFWNDNFSYINDVEWFEGFYR